MSDEFRRLIDDPAHASIKSVLEAGMRDRHSAAGFGRTAKALGVGSSVALTTITAASTAKAAAPLGTKSVLLAFAKWLGAGLVIGGVVSAPLIARKTAAPISAPAELDAPSTVERAPIAPPIRAVEIAPQREAPAQPEIAGAPERPVTARAGTPVAAPTAPPPPNGSTAKFEATSPPSSLDEEIALLDSARRALKQGDSSGALAALDQHARQRSKHALDAEATLLRVQALVAAGRTSEAKSIAKRVLDANPNGGYACRLAKLAGLATDTCPSAVPR